MVSPSIKRRAVKEVIGEGMCRQAQACRALGLARSTSYFVSRERIENRRLRKEIVDFSEQQPRYGYRRITALLRRDEWRVNHKRVRRVRKEEGLKVSKKQRKMKRVGVSTAERQKAEHPNHVWSWDFVSDQTENGSNFRILTLIDEHTRQWLAVHVAWSIRAVDVITIVEAAMELYGVPEHIRSDNGPEFIAYAIQDWLREKGVKSIYITPGSPWENGHIESFHDKLRDEFLNREVFGSLLEAKVLTEQHRFEYNQDRPHSSLGYKTPNEAAACWKIPLRPSASTPSSSTNNQHINQEPLLYF
jgi:transposase InsO family protein